MFLQSLILFERLRLLLFLKGFLFVIAQIIFLSLNFFIASLDIAKWPLCGGSNEPPKLQFYFFLNSNYFLTKPLLEI